jgi:hypothetical protein
MSRRPAGHETRDAPSMIGVLGIGVIAAVLVMALGLVALLLFAFKSASPDRGAYAPPPRQGPALETQPGQTLAVVHARIPGATTNYGWADPTHDLARIPIDRALQITAQRGWSNASPRAKP